MALPDGTLPFSGGAMMGGDGHYVSRDDIYKLRMTRGGFSTEVYDPLQSPDTEVDVNETELFSLTRPGIYSEIEQSLGNGRIPTITIGVDGRIRHYYYTARDVQGGTMAFTNGHDGIVEILTLRSDGTYDIVRIPGKVSVLKGNCGEHSIAPEPEGDAPEDWDCYEVEKEGEDIWIGDDKRVHAKAGWYHVDMGVYIKLNAQEADARADVLFGAYTGTVPTASFNYGDYYSDYRAVDFDLSYDHGETYSVGFDIRVENDGDIIHLSASAPTEYTAECCLDWFSVHKITKISQGGGGGGGSGDCNVFIGYVDTTYAEWKAASDAGKALMFSYSSTVGENTVTLNPMQTKVTVLPTGVVMIGCTLTVMGETVYIELWLQHDSETDEDTLTFAYFGMLVAGRALMTVDIDTGNGEPTMLGLLALPGLDPADILNGDFDPSDYTSAQLNAAILLGFVKMRTEFDWMLVEEESGTTRDAFIPVPEDKLIGASESMPALCRFHRGWMPDDNTDGPPTLKYRKVRAVLTYDHDLDEEVLTFPITPIYMNFETDPEA